MTDHSRRTFLQAGATLLGAVALTSMPRPLLATLDTRPEPLPPIGDPRVKKLAQRGLDAARGAGATYADVRLTHTHDRDIDPNTVFDRETMVVGVRALVNGCWGFAAGPVWRPEELVRLGREAVHQARSNAFGQSREVDLAPVPTIGDGHWVMPVERDPFEISPFEIQDFLGGLHLFASRLPDVKGRNVTATFHLQERATATSEGSYCTQRLYRTAGLFTMKLVFSDGRTGAGSLSDLTPAGLGWELFAGQPLREAIRRLAEEIKEDAYMRVKAADVGRYETAVDARGVANLLDQTIGRATELDRALGYEANASGTSFLSDPLSMLGSYTVGASTFTVTGNRSEPGGAATVKWDDDGVPPDDVTLIRDGVLDDFQTTRESAAWLKAYYERTGRPFRSHGCASSPSAVDAPLTHTPNLVLTPGPERLDFDAFVEGLGSGIAIKDLAPRMDFQGATGLGMGRIYEVKHGKRIARLAGAGILFRSTDLWKGLIAVGGGSAARRYGMAVAKGEPAQTCYHSVTSPPAVFKDVTLIDAMRKA